MLPPVLSTDRTSLLEGVDRLAVITEIVVGLDGELAAQLELQDEAAQRLRKLRHAHGALDLATIEAHAVVKGGTVVDLEIQEQNRARQVIEDIMIAANGATARYLEARKRSSIRRVVVKPKRWDRIVELAAGLGTTLPAEPSAPALSDFLAARS